MIEMPHVLSDRILTLRERVLTTPAVPDVGWPTSSWRAAATVAEHYFTHCETVIHPAELIVGGKGALPSPLPAVPDDESCWPDSDPQPAANLDAFFEQGFLIRCGNHQVANYRHILSQGLTGILKNIELQLAVPGRDGHSREFLIAMRALATSVIRYCHRYAQTARDAMQMCDDLSRREELETIADNCDYVIEHPARTFWEACQALYFAYVLVPDSPGRIDQYLHPYYRRDIDSGRITRDFAEELLSCLWIKYFEFVGKDHTRSGVTHLALGGLTPESGTAVNDVSYLCLDVAEKLAIWRPQIALRWNRGTPRQFIRRGVEALRNGTGSPDFSNDEQLVPALTRIGILPADARDYCPSGCNEIMIPGKSHMGALTGQFNLPKTLSCVLGTEGMPLSRPVDLAALTSWEVLWEAWRQTLSELVNALHEWSYVEEARRARAAIWFTGSLVTDHCIERGKGMTQGGAQYNFCNWDAIGIADLADSFMALKRIVFEDGELTLQQFAECLHRNWDGHAELRQRVKHALPHFGNDCPEVDSIAADIIRETATHLDRHTPYRGGKYTLGTLAGYENAHVRLGRQTGATPDGRRAGEPFASGLSPAPGKDRNGMTAMLNSVAALPHRLLPTSTIVNVTIVPDLLDTPDGVDKITAAIIGHFTSGGQQLQFTLADSSLLRAAQENPADHESLMVRVAGYSAKFISLDKAVQDEIIARTVNCA